MWLLNAGTRQLELAIDGRSERYAILSHTWEDDEVSFQDIQYNFESAKRKRGYKKIDFICEQALSDHLDYVWADTCCIDKTSSAELSETINSMFDYYVRASICYTLLLDADANIYISRCKWFTRGWTLQELLASSRIKFFGPRWNFIGTKEDLLDTIEDITRIDREALMQPRSLNTYSVATKMSWAAGRQTKRAEDRAYSLLGLFDVQMPLIYGEGRRKAFCRFQKEIISNSTDQSIFVWCPSSGLYSPGRHQLLADSPDDFKLSSRVVTWQEGLQSPYYLSNCGLEVRLPVIKDDSGRSYGILQCRSTHIFTGPLALRLRSWTDGRWLSSSSEMEQKSLAYEVDRYPGCTFEGENQVDGEHGLFGLSFIPLEKLDRAKLTLATILKEPALPSSLTFARLSGPCAWPKVWIQMQALEQEKWFQSRVVPANLWVSGNTFDSTAAATHSGLKTWDLADGSFVLAFRICPEAMNAAESPKGLHMIIAQPKGTSKEHGATNWEPIMNTLLEHTEPVTVTSAHFAGWRNVHAQAAFIERMGERIYRIDVTISKDLQSYSNDSTSPESRKRRRS